MKRVLLALILSSSIAFAQSNAEKHAERVQTMQDLESAMSFMQKGFLYNNEGMIKKGVMDFKDKLRNIDSFVIDVDNQGEDRSNRFNPRTYASVETKAISKLIDGVMDNFKKGNKDESIKYFHKTLDRCLTCHKVVRKW
jgi:cytochrome c556